MLGSNDWFDIHGSNEITFFRLSKNIGSSNQILMILGLLESPHQKESNGSSDQILMILGSLESPHQKESNVIRF
ncbi:hypothetical protein RCL_jg27800.t1 [Rhizophagus clarus]|uniref:Uncharacterized protein n=1 Tax=Rhizophagus clarus TaxID=94130 RepID=A0A8H3QNB4_9GLOM|nr:hypothetical protein RCL_jg27800.t1 [Rhizophagus clarus]